MKYYGRIERLGLPMLTVNYRDLVANPNEKLRQICDAIGMEYFDGKERFWEKEAHHIFGSPSVRKQTESKASGIAEANSFASEFSAELAFVRERLDHDSEMQRLLEVVQRYDVGLVENSLSPVKTIQRQTLPSWYYWQRAKRVFYRRFPRSMPVSRIKEKAL